MERVCTREDNAIFSSRGGRNEKWVDLKVARYQIHPLFLHATDTRYACALDHQYKHTRRTIIITKLLQIPYKKNKSVPLPSALLLGFWTAVSFAVWGNSCHVAEKLVVVTETSSS